MAWTYERLQFSEINIKYCVGLLYKIFEYKKFLKIQWKPYLTVVSVSSVSSHDTVRKCERYLRDTDLSNKICPSGVTRDSLARRAVNQLRAWKSRQLQRSILKKNNNYYQTRSCRDRSNIEPLSTLTCVLTQSLVRIIHGYRYMNVIVGVRIVH